ncbi:hypothetical protein [Streptomyces sp. NPDC046261]|uniref:hypothetical protein n=1 Tax=Streptomyces sp. NPDC046261 TaxID=3157200 RepID=UPI0033DC28A1
MLARKNLAIVTSTAILSTGLALAPSVSAVASPHDSSVPRAALGAVDKHKSVKCGLGKGPKVEIWYRDYDNNRTMLREAYFQTGADRQDSAHIYWRADDGKTTIQKKRLSERTHKWSDSQTKDVAIAKNRKPYVKIVFHKTTNDCTKYIDLN